MESTKIMYFVLAKKIPFLKQTEALKHFVKFSGLASRPTVWSKTKNFKLQKLALLQTAPVA